MGFLLSRADSTMFVPDETVSATGRGLMLTSLSLHAILKNRLERFSC